MSSGDTHKVCSGLGNRGVPDLGISSTAWPQPHLGLTAAGVAGSTACCHMYLIPMGLGACDTLKGVTHLPTGNGHLPCKVAEPGVGAAVVASAVRTNVGRFG